MVHRSLNVSTFRFYLWGNGKAPPGTRHPAEISCRFILWLILWKKSLVWSPRPSSSTLTTPDFAPMWHRPCPYSYLVYYILFYISIKLLMPHIDDGRGMCPNPCRAGMDERVHDEEGELQASSTAQHVGEDPSSSQRLLQVFSSPRNLGCCREAQKKSPQPGAFPESPPGPSWTTGSRVGRGSRFPPGAAAIKPR